MIYPCGRGAAATRRDEALQNDFFPRGTVCGETAPGTRSGVCEQRAVSLERRDVRLVVCHRHRGPPEASTGDVPGLPALVQGGVAAREAGPGAGEGVSGAAEDINRLRAHGTCAECGGRGWRVRLG